MVYFLDKYRISFEDSCKLLNEYLLIQHDNDKRINMIKNVLIQNIIYELKDLTYYDSFDEHCQHKNKRLVDLENLFN